MTREQQIIEQAGAAYLGVESGLVWFNDPATHSTLTVDGLELLVLDEPAAVEHVRRAIVDRRRAFAAAFSGA